MCGITGCAGNIDGDVKKAFRMLLIMDSMRGEDSTGVAFVNKLSNGVHVHKQQGDPFVLLYNAQYDKTFNMVNKVMIGHNRYATSGGVSRATAHPFEFDSVVGVHNGTLSSKWKLKDSKDFQVDSEALYHNFDKYGVEETINLLGADGNAWSLVWWNKDESTLNFLRNKERPMFICATEDEKTIFWASERWMINMALMRSGIKHGEVLETTVDTHYSIPISKNGEVGQPVLKHVAAPYIEPISHNSFVHNRYNYGNHQKINRETSTNIVEIKKGKEVVVPKKEIGSPLSKKDYGLSKEVLFEILSNNTDSNGAKYLCLFDANHAYAEIRMYPRKEDSHLFHYVGQELIGDISQTVICDSTSIRGYYKVNPWTAKLAIKTGKEKDEVEDVFITSKGTLVIASEWKKLHSVCAWCSDSLNPLQANRFTTTHDCLCPECAENPLVVEYVKFA
jgi:predicted glutamine amidotransferase